MSAAGVGLFPHYGDDIYKGVRLRLLMLGYTWNRALQSKMLELNMLTGLCSLFGNRGQTSITMAENLIEATEQAKRLLVGGPKQKAKIETLDPAEEYKRVFGDVNFEEIDKILKSKASS